MYGTDSVPYIEPWFINVPDVKLFMIFTQSQGLNMSVLVFHCFIVIFIDNIHVITITTAADLQQQKLITQIN